MQTPSLALNGHDDATFAPPRAATEAELAEAWFDAPPASTRRPSAPPPPVSAVGEFLGDPLADSWLR
jgi:hypothetical protein